MTEMRQKRVLLVDDDESVRSLVAALLSSLGVAVVTARNGVQALALFLSDTFDVVFTDYEMPQMRGDELARLIKATDPTQRIVMVTGSMEDVVQHGTLPSYIDALVPKPCSINQLIDALNTPLRSLGGSPMHELAA